MILHWRCFELKEKDPSMTQDVEFRKVISGLPRWEICRKFLTTLVQHYIINTNHISCFNKTSLVCALAGMPGPSLRASFPRWSVLSRACLVPVCELPSQLLFHAICCKINVFERNSSLWAYVSIECCHYNTWDTRTIFMKCDLCSRDLILVKYAKIRAL